MACTGTSSRGVLTAAQPIITWIQRIYGEAKERQREKRRVEAEVVSEMIEDYFIIREPSKLLINIVEILLICTFFVLFDTLLLTIYRHYNYKATSKQL